VYPHPIGPWTVASIDRHAQMQWTRFDPDSGRCETVDPRRDPALPAMELVAASDELIGYRIGRRAVFRSRDRFTKIVRPKRFDRLLHTHHHLNRTLETNVATPTVTLAVDAGLVELSPVPGRGLHDLLRCGTADDVVIRAVAAALAAFHSVDPVDQTTRTPDTPSRWITTVQRQLPELGPRLQTVAARLPTIKPPSPVVTHGDLHDKNILVDRSNGGSPRIGLIDFDGVALGGSEDDLANLGVHVQLRSLQAGSDVTVAQAQAERLYDAYTSHAALDHERLEQTERHTWFRLACLYRVRKVNSPKTQTLFEELLARSLSPTDRLS